MNHKLFPLIKQSGFTLIEVLVSLIIFALVMLGSALLLGKSLNIQKESTINQIVINTLQERLQAAASTPLSLNNCTSIDLTSFTLASDTYYVGCAYQTITVNSTSVYWPVLAVSTTSATLATSCANGTASDTTSCFILGK